MKSKLIWLSVLALAACGGGGGSNSSDKRESAPTTKSVSIAFDAVADGTPIQCDTVYALGSANTNVALEDFRFYIHNLRLITDSGEEIPVELEQNDWQNGEVALLDFQNKSDKCAGADKPVHTSINGTVPSATTFTGVRFTVGLPQALNHQLNTSQPSPLNIGSLFWGWQSGYKFMRLDFAPVEGGIKQDGSPFTAWNFHLGSTNCSGDPQVNEVVSCSNANRADIELTGFDPDSHSIQMDYSALVLNNNLAEDMGGAPGCMSGVTDPECNEVFSALGLNLASGQSDSAFVQTVFQVLP